MDNRFYDSVLGEMNPFFEENGFTLQEDGSFLCEKKAVRISYNEERQMYVLEMADVEEGKAGDFSEVSSWLFDDTQTAKDAESVGIDFVNTVRDSMGIKIKRAAVANVDLPTADKTGSLTVSGFTKKVLDVYPQYKDAYKDHIAQYGNFLYLNFFAEYFVPQIKEVLNANTKKTVKKLYELLEHGYIEGDRETVNAVVAVLSAAVCDDEKLKNAALTMLDADPHFKKSVEAFIPIMAKKKKFREALIKN